MSVRVKHRIRVIADPKFADDWQELHLLPTAPRKVIDAAYRALSTQYHPDAGGGDPEAQARLNAAYSRLVELVKEHAEP